MTVQVFISYGREDADAAARLRDELESEGVDVWFDRNSLRPGERWKLAIANAIRKSKYFIALLSSSSVSRRGYLNAEIREALAVVAELPANEPFIIPVRLDECESTHPELSEFNRVNLFPSWDDGVRQLRQLFEQPSTDGGHSSWLIRAKPGFFKQLFQQITTLPGVVATHALLGKFDLLVDFDGKDISPQFKVLREMPGVEDVTMIFSIAPGKWSLR
jgi:nitrate reductase NapAB chaperone NapD